MKRERRPYQTVAHVAVREVRQIVLYWARRCRKSTTLGDIGFDEMSLKSGRLVIAASASLLLGKELVGVTLSAAEQAMIVANESAAMRAVFEDGAEDRRLDLKVADSNHDKILTGLTPEDFAELYQSSRMELRLYFDRTGFSKLQVIAPNPATARSWRATVLRDEAGFTNPNFETDLRNATDPMMRDTPDLKIIYASNLSGNSRHPYFTTTLPREITAETEDEQFAANPNGHLYIGQDGILVHRVALKDAYAAGHCLFDDHSTPMTYSECQSFPQFKSGWDETYALNHKSGGAAAIDFVALLSGQRRGVGKCNFVYVENEADIQRAAKLLIAMLGRGRVGVGWDVASTTNEKSNPSSITFTEDCIVEHAQRLTVVFKERRGDVAIHWVRVLLEAVRDHTEAHLQRLCIDGSNERLFAQKVLDTLSSILPVEIILNGSPVDPVPPGYTQSINFKTFLGDIYSESVNSGRTILPPDEYIKKDHLLPIKDSGKYDCPVDVNGCHGDTFDSGKNAEYALISRAGSGVASNVPMAGNNRTANGGRGHNGRQIGGML